MCIITEDSGERFTLVHNRPLEFLYRRGGDSQISYIFPVELIHTHSYRENTLSGLGRVACQSTLTIATNKLSAVLNKGVVETRLFLKEFPY